MGRDIKSSPKLLNKDIIKPELFTTLPRMWLKAT